MKLLAALGSVSASFELSADFYFDEIANRIFKNDNSSSYELTYFQKYRENIENASFSCVSATIDETSFHGEPWDASSNDGDKCIYLIDADKTKRSWADAQAVCEAWFKIKLEASYEDGYWNDNNCNSAFFYVCQAYKHEPQKTPNGDEKWPLQGYCKAGWKKFGRACFKILGAQIDDPDHQIQSTFEEAKTRCGQESVGGWSGATLAIFPNVYYNHFATALSKNLGAQKSYWIGALSTTQDMTFHWIDESRMTFTSWLPGEPNGQPNGEEDPEDFVEMLWTGGNGGFGQYFPGQWNDLYGSRKLPFMCSHTLSTSEKAEENSCPSGWMSSKDASGRPEGFCYKLVSSSTTDTNFQGARDYCGSIDKNMQIDLASVEDFYENSLLTALFYEEFGLNGENPINKDYAAWIGLTMSWKENSKGEKYVKTSWVDGFPAAYTEWAKAEPDMNSIRHDPEFSCAYIDNKKEWHLSDKCNDKLPFICKANVGGIKPPDWSNGDPRGDLLDCEVLGEDWHNLNDDWNEHHCVRAFAGNVGWHEAEHSCNGHGAHLVSMHNEAYNSRLRSFATTKWTDGSAVTYSNWRGSPSENVDDECTELWRDNYWQLAKCKETRPYVCKRRRPQEYCWGQSELDKEPCGYAGITENSCVFDFQCCYDPAAAISCFKDSKNKTSSGMSIAGAVVLASFIWALCAAAVVFFFMKR
ncbi:unnamed protein product [Oikopleura dioica]|uniref:C-type lectin domain-containing protein n=1 Tax=Oikopleura dioica TaxID=34765 RepID=E4X1V1_OIKDI|nr:unnamed protein product [Oikopleura dioica]